MAPYNRTRQEMVERAIRLWQVHAESYRIMPLQYQFLLAEKRRLGIAPLNKIHKSVLNNYPDIPFLKISDETTAKATLEKLSNLKLAWLIRWLEDIVECNPAFRTLRNRIIDYTYEIDHYETPVCPFGFDPEYSKRSAPKCTTKRRPAQL